jgi:hypothetical protein
MKRYLVRSLVAVLAFLIGVGVSSALRPAVKYRYRERDCYRKKSHNVFRNHGRHSGFRTPSVLVDAVATDPLKLIYSSTNNNGTYVGQQRIEFNAANLSKKNIQSYTVSYLTGFPHERGAASGAVTMDPLARVGNLRSGYDEIVSIDVNSRETLTVWVSSVEFTDGSRWTNPRH